MSFSIGDHVDTQDGSGVIEKLADDGGYYEVRVTSRGVVCFYHESDLEIDQEYYDEQDDDLDLFTDVDDEDDWNGDVEDPTDSHFDYESRARETDFSKPEVDPISALLRGGADG